MRLTLDEFADMRSDLSDLQDAMGLVSQAALIVAGMPNLAGPVVIDMTAGQPVTINTGYVMPDHPPIVRPVAPPVEIVEQKQDTVSIEVPQDPLTGGAVLEDAAPKAGAERGAAPAAKDGPKTGPFSDAEKAEIKRLHKMGRPPQEVAKALNRRVQTVSLFMRNLDRKAAQPAVAPQPAPKAVAVKLAPEPVANPPKPAVSLRAEVVAERRRIARALDKIGHAAPFDAGIDLDIAQAQFEGGTLNELSLDLGIDQRVMTERFRVISACIRDDRGAVTIDGKIDLVAVLRERAEQGAA